MQQLSHLLFGSIGQKEIVSSQRNNFVIFTSIMQVIKFYDISIFQKAQRPPVGNLRNQVHRAYLALEHTATLVKQLHFIIVSTVVEMRSLVELRRDFGGWDGSISVDPRATRFTRLEIRCIVGEENISISTIIGIILLRFFISVFNTFVVTNQF